MQELNYNPSRKIGFEYVESARYGAIMDANMSESVFNKLFVRHLFPEKYFKPLRIRGPYYQLWEVKGDTYKIINQPK